MERAAQAAREAADGRFGTVRIGYNFSAWQEVLPNVLVAMHERYPHIVVELSELRSAPSSPPWPPASWTSPSATAGPPRPACGTGR
ncbi:hypothetical protein [Thermocatellispora tengchongensis]|uniref:hypothetical protein n=1 Tax=Thermocatellispora tengchongensis TaxID=1073253 RepID=UPI00363CD6E6